MGSANGAKRDLSVGIVGAGFGGVGIAIKLREAGFDRFEIFERGDSVGGVWRANTYPGAACDVPSHLYSYSFAPGHHWSRRYAPQAEILAYLEEVSRDYGIAPHLRLGTEVTGAEFDAGSGRWTVRTDDGAEHGFDVLVTACGQLTRPAIPPLEGIESFAGPSFHSAEWDHDVDLDRPHRGGDRDGRERDPAGPRDRRRSPSGPPSTSGPPPGSSAGPTGAIPTGSGPCSGASRLASRRPGWSTSRSSSCSPTGSRGGGRCCRRSGPCRISNAARRCAAAPT